MKCEYDLFNIFEKANLCHFGLRRLLIVQATLVKNGPHVER